MSALNATLFASSRIAFSMSRDRLLPSGLSELSEETRSPYLSIIASTTVVGMMAVALPIEIVASSVVMFLLLFSMVNVATIVMRRNQPDLERPFERWLTAYAYYYNHLRNHQALDNQPPVEAAGLS